jgi:hypothetical protein
VRAISDVCFMPNPTRGRCASVAALDRPVVWSGLPGTLAPSARPDRRRGIGAALGNTQLGIAWACRTTMGLLPDTRLRKTSHKVRNRLAHVRYRAGSDGTAISLPSGRTRSRTAGIGSPEVPGASPAIFLVRSLWAIGPCLGLSGRVLREGDRRSAFRGSWGRSRWA